MLAIWRPGASEAEERTQSGLALLDQPRHKIDDVLNELGAEGWELATSEVTASAAGPVRGYPEAGTAISQEWTFKRPVG